MVQRLASCATTVATATSAVIITGLLVIISRYVIKDAAAVQQVLEDLVASWDFDQVSNQTNQIWHL
jgi:hypothetical protein